MAWTGPAVTRENGVGEGTIDRAMGWDAGVESLRPHPEIRIPIEIPRTAPRTLATGGRILLQR
jgi:hypothetical protein